MNLPQLFRSYELLANRADEAFLKMENEHPACIKHRSSQIGKPS